MITLNETRMKIIAFDKLSIIENLNLCLERALFRLQILRKLC